LFGVGLLLEGEAAAGHLEHVELPEVLVDLVGVGYCLLGYREQVEADVSTQGFGVELEVFEVVGEEVEIVQKRGEEDEGVVREAEEVIVVGDDGVLLCLWDFYDLVDPIQNFCPFYSHVLVFTAHEHSFEDRDDGLEFLCSIVVGVVDAHCSFKKFFQLVHVIVRFVHQWMFLKDDFIEDNA
jgi:hypothetical protein